MENTNAEVVNSQDLLKSIFKDFEPQETEVVTPPVQEQIVATPPTQETPIVTEPVIPEAPKVIVTDYSKRLKTLIADGFIENVAITYNDEEAFLDDIKDLDEESYNQIIKSYKEEKEKEHKSKYISTEKFDDQTKKLLEIKQAGGNISDIIRENVTAIEQLQQLKDNIDNENVQANIVGKDLEQRGLDFELIKSQIKVLIDKGELEAKATEILDSHLSVQSEAIEQKRTAELKRLEDEKEGLKNQRKDLSAKYKEYGLPENIQKVLVDNATKLDNERISNTDKLYFEAQKNPELFAELNFFLNNPEEFKKWVSSKKVLDSKLDNVKKAFSINISNTKKPKISSQTSEELVDEIIKNYNN